MSAVLRIKELHKTRARKEKLKNLRKRYALAKNDDERTFVIEKMRRVAPWLSEEEFLSPNQNPA